MYFLIFGWGCGGSTSASAALLGDVSDVLNLPGYVETDRSSAFYRGVVSRKDRGDSIERRSPSEAIVSFFEGDRLSAARVNKFIGRLQRYRQSAYLIECQDEAGLTEARACDADTGVQKKWKSNAYRIATEFAEAGLVDLLAHPEEIPLSAINEPSAQKRVAQLFSALEIWEAVKGEDRQRGARSPRLQGILKVPTVLQRSQIAAGGPEAANLLVPPGHPRYGRQLFLSEADLREMRARGEDLSRLNPPSSGMWRQPRRSIRLFDTSNYDGAGLAQLRRVLDAKEVEDLVDPEREVSVVYKHQELSGGMTPKFDVNYAGVKFKLKFITDKHGHPGAKNIVNEIQKLVWGSEANVEPAVNNLAAALGYTVDPTYFKRVVRVYFDDEVYERGEFDIEHRRMIDHLSERYDGTINTPSALRAVKADSRGRKYIEMKSVTFEQKSHPETDLNIGFFDHAGLGKDLAREHRAFFLFLAWVGDPDVKNDNDKVKLAPDGAGYKVMTSNSDLGASFGLGFPNIYNYKLVKKLFRDGRGQTSAIRFNFPRLFEFPLQGAVTMNDARWFARLLGQLTSAQLERAFRFAGYPDVVARYYGLLAAGKRNELLRALDLIGTSFVNEQGETVRLELLPEFTGTIAGYEEFFRDGLLTDSENRLQDPARENWARGWGISRRLRHEDAGIAKELKRVFVGDVGANVLRLAQSFLKQGIIHKQGGVDFARPGLHQHPLSGEGAGEYSLADIDYGVRNLVPLRLLIDNPDVENDRAHPTWRVDIMRFGGFVGDSGGILQDLLGFDPPEGTQVSAGARVFKVVEAIRITPVGGAQDFYANTQEFLDLPKYALKSLREDLVRGLESNETLIVTSYAGVEAMARVRGQAFVGALAGARISGHLERIRRATVHRKGEDYFLNFGRETRAGGSAGVYVPDLMIKVPVLRQNIDRSGKTERTFVFSTNELGVLGAQLRKPDPAAIPDANRLDRRAIRSRDRATLVSAVGIRGYTRRVEYTRTDYRDYRHTLEKNAKKLGVAIEQTKIRDISRAVWEKKAEVFVDSTGASALALEFKLDYPSAKREKFLKIFDRYEAYFPASTLFFDRRDIKHYMGVVQIETKLIFTNEMLGRIFSAKLGLAEICAAASHLSAAECRRALYPAYVEARGDYREIVAKKMESNDRAMKRLAKFFLLNDDLGVIRFAKNWVGRSDLIEDVRIESSLAAFPGDVDTIKMKTNTASLKDFKKELGFDPEIFSDQAQDALADYFFETVR